MVTGEDININLFIVQQNISWNTFGSFPGSCGEPPEMVGGSYIGADMWIGDVLELRCDDGYDLINGEDNTITCQSDGEWTSSNASCKREFGLSPSLGLTNAID